MKSTSTLKHKCLRSLCQHPAITITLRDDRDKLDTYSISDFCSMTCFMAFYIVVTPTALQELQNAFDATNPQHPVPVNTGVDGTN